MSLPSNLLDLPDTDFQLVRLKALHSSRSCSIQLLHDGSSLAVGDRFNVNSILEEQISSITINVLCCVPITYCQGIMQELSEGVGN